MRVGIDYGLKHAEFDLPDERLVAVERAPQAPALADPVAAVRSALEQPFHWPALRQALTPDDHVALVVDEQLACLGRLLAPILDHLAAAGIQPNAITLVCPPTTAPQGWVDELPDAFEEVRVEIHDPTDRNKLAYLATTRQGRRLYLNRTVVDADQLVVLTGRRFDPLVGHAGAELALYPVLSDEATRAERFVKGTRDDWQREALEVAWLLGAPFLVQIIEGAGDEVQHVVAGSLDASPEGRRLLAERWQVRVSEPADLVLASIGGDPAQHDFATLARALANAAQVVRPGGRLVLLTAAHPPLGPAGELIRGTEAADELRKRAKTQPGTDRLTVLHWADAVQQAKVYLLSGLAEEDVEELFVTHLQHAGQAQRLLAGGGSCLVLPDAHKTLAVLAE